MLPDDAAEAILLAHLKRDIRACTCGWAELGKSHPRHQVAMLREAGLLNDEETEKLRNEVADYRALFDLQWKRSIEAMNRWRAEDPEARASVMPDLGDLLRWLMDDADQARAELAKVRGEAAADV